MSDRTRVSLCLLGCVFVLPAVVAAQRPEKVTEPSPSLKIEKVGEPKIPTKDYAQTYFQPFKSGVRPAGWGFTTATAEEWVHFEAAGLRLTMPAGSPGERPSAGIQSAFGVKGDFEITLNFEFLKEPAPSDDGKFATRLLMGVALDTPLSDKEGAALNRSLSIKGERNFTTWMRNRDFPKGVLGGRPTMGTTGRLRLVRSGAELFFLTSAAADQPFTLIKKNRFGTENLKRVAITGATGNETALLDVRLTDFSIRADAIPGVPAADAAAEPQAAPSASSLPEGGRGWLVPALVAGLAIALLGALAAWFLLRRRDGAAAQAPADAVRMSVSFACPECGKGLKTKAAMAGKKVKCRCGTAVLVPSMRGT